MLTNQAVFNAFEEVKNTQLPAVYWKVSAEVIIPDVRTIKLQKVTAVHDMCNYLEHIGDAKFLSAQMGAVTYKELLYPNRSNLTLRLIMKLQGENGKELTGGASLIYDYRAYLLDAQDIDLLSISSTMDDLVTLESSNLLDIRFQLIDVTLETMRLSETFGVYLGATSGDVLRSCLSFGLRDNTSTEKLSATGYSGVRGVNIVTPHNSAAINHVVIPTGTRITKLAKYLQSTYGIYGAGIATYYSKGFWHVFPPYDHSRFSEGSKTLTVLNVPSDELRGIERTFRRDGESLIVFSTGDTSSVEIGDKVNANLGDGFAFTKSSDIEGGMFTTSANKSTPTQTWMAVSTEEQASGLQNIRYVENRFTDNPYKELSVSAMANGKTLSLNWDNSAPTLLYPGMPVRVLYMRNSAIERLDGVLIGSNSSVNTTTGLITDNDYRSSTKLIVHVSKV